VIKVSDFPQIIIMAPQAICLAVDVELVKMDIRMALDTSLGQGGELLIYDAISPFLEMTIPACRLGSMNPFKFKTCF
jgi:hypothetical protein